MRKGGVTILRGCQRNDRTGILASFDGIKAFAKGKFEINLIRYHGIQSHDLVFLKIAMGVSTDAILPPFPTADPSLLVLETQTQTHPSN